MNQPNTHRAATRQLRDGLILTLGLLIGTSGLLAPELSWLLAGA